MNTPPAPTTESPIGLPELPVEETVSPASPPLAPVAAPENPQEKHQRTFLLQQVAQADNQRLTRGEANRKLTKAVSKSLGLDPDTAHRIREKMAGEQLLTITKKGASTSYQLTPHGRDYLRTAEPYPPPPAIPEHLLPYMKAFILLELFLKRGETATKGELERRLPRASQRTTAKRKASSPLQELGLTAGPVADRVRQLLAEKGYITVAKVGRAIRCTLTSDGLEYLTTLQQYPEIKFNVAAEQLNQLMRASREASFRAPEAAPAARVEAQPTAAELEKSLFEAFEELRREKYQRSGMVPIYEIRRQVAARLGPTAARHDVFDEAAKQLWRSGRVRMVSIAEPDKATTDQLRDSIEGIGETLFYLEAAHEHAVL